MIFAAIEGKIKKIFINQRAWNDKFYAVNFFIVFTAALLVWAEIIWARFAIGVPEDFLSLHYSIYFGVDWLGNYWDFAVFGLFTTFAAAVNIILANIFFDKNKILSYFYIGAASCVGILMLIATGLTVYINL
jgi:hypothetical protein